MELIDYAHQKFLALMEEIKSYDHTIFTEEDSRVKIIDRILIEVLNYNYEDLSTEPASAAGFIDYKISIRGIGRLVIEAKRDGVAFEIDSSYSGSAYKLNGPLFKNKVIKEGLGQTIYYAAQESIELGCLTNGKTWIIFRANRLADGTRVWEGKAVVFSSLLSVQKNFKLFYELLAPEPIHNLMYRAIFQELEGKTIRTKDFVQSLRTEETLRLIETNYSDDFSRIMNTFFSRLSGDDDPEFLINCFVETKESRAAEFQLARISEDLINKVKTIETSEAQAIQKVIERIKQTNRQEFVILVGAKGAGKSTFVDRFFKHVLTSNLKKECIIVKINVGSYKGSDLEITKWLDQTVLDVCEKVLYNGAPTSEEIQGIFFGEYNRLKKAKSMLYTTDKVGFKIEFSNHIEERREKRPTEYIQKLIGNIVKSRKKIPCIIFDNADHFSIQIQEQVFQYGRSIYENEICLVLVPITDKTSWQLSNKGAIRSYENEVMYLPTPSPKKVIEKRINYLDSKVKSEKISRGQYFFKKGIQIELKNLEKFVRYLQSVFIYDRLVSKWIGSLSNFDIRTTLEITRDIIASPHISVIEFLKAYVEKEFDNPIKPYRIKNAIVKRGYHSYPVNHHPYVQNLFYCTGDVNTSPLLGLRILQLLMDRKSDRSAEDGFLLVQQIEDYFSAMSIERTIVHNHLQFLLSKGLISSYDPSNVDIDYSRSVELTPSGIEHYYWTLNDKDFVFIMAEVTPITNKALFQEFQDTYYNHHSKATIITKFLDYLENEDSAYCHLPDHESYKGQKFIHTRFDWTRKILKRIPRNK